MTDDVEQVIAQYFAKGQITVRRICRKLKIESEDRSSIVFIGNALKYLEKEGRLKRTRQRPAEFLRVSVKLENPLALLGSVNEINTSNSAN